MSDAQSVGRQKSRRWLLIGVGGLVAVLIVGAIVVYAIGREVPSEDPVQNDRRQFPEIVGTNLRFNEISLPSDLPEGPKLIVVSYDESQQPDVDEWVAPLEDLQKDYPALSGSYAPLLPKSASDSALFIIGGMALIANNAEREQTIVVFTDIDLFNQQLGIATKDDIQLFLLDDQNQIRWRESGPTSDEKIESLRSVLDGL